MNKSPKHKLTPKQAKFASLYVELGNATEAYRKVYSWRRMKPETVNRNAKALLDTNKISARINEIRVKIEENSVLSKEEIIKDLKIISSVTIQDYIELIDPITESVIWKPLDKWTHAMKRACTGIKPTANGIELTVSGIEYAYNRIAKMMGYDAPTKIIQADTTLEDLLKKE